MKTFIRILACLVLCLFFSIPNVLTTLIGFMLPTNYFSEMTILIIYPILIVTFAFVGFNLSQVISLSKGGLRYKVIAIFTIITGSLGAFSIFRRIYESASLLDIFASFGNLLTFIRCFINTHFIYGVTILILYKHNYKKIR